jgi:hypothetical protein
MLVDVLRPFSFSRDGVTPERAEAGQSVDVPDAYAAGLEAEGFVRAVRPQPPRHRPGLFTPPTDDAAALRARYEAATGRPADRRWGLDRLAQEVVGAEA